MALAALAAAAMAAEPPPPGAWAELVQAEQPTEAQVQALLEAIGRDPDRLRALIAADTAYPAMQPGWQRQTHAIDGRDHDFDDAEFYVRIPAAYTPRKAWPVLVVCHGQGGSGREFGAVYERLLGKAADEVILVSPTMPGGPGYNGRPYQELAYLQPLRWVRRRCNVDDSRIFVSGYSQGGHASWHLGAMFPRHFAGIVPMAGVPLFEGSLPTATLFLENLEHVAVWQRWGEHDRAADNSWGNVDFARMVDRRLKGLRHPRYTGEEIEGAGHGDIWPADGKALSTFLQTQARVAHPERFTHLFHLRHHTRGYWVEALNLTREPLDFTKRIEIPVQAPAGRQPTANEIYTAQSQYLRQRLFRLDVSTNPRTNLVLIRPQGIDRVRVYVPDGLFDLSRPLTVRLGQRAWRGAAPASAECMLRHYLETRDGQARIVNEIDIDLTGEATVRYPAAAKE